MYICIYFYIHKCIHVYVYMCMSHTCECIMSHTWTIAHTWKRYVRCTNRRGTLHMWMNHVAHMDASCLTNKCVMSHVWMSHVHAWMSHVSHMNALYISESCDTHLCVSHVCTHTYAHTQTVSHVMQRDTPKWVMSDMHESCHTLDWVTSSRATKVHEPRAICRSHVPYTRVTSHVNESHLKWMSHVS